MKRIAVMAFACVLAIAAFAVHRFVSFRNAPETPIEIRGGRGGQTIGADGEDSDAFEIINGKIVMTKKGGGGKGGKGGKITGEKKAIERFLKQFFGLFSPQSARANVNWRGAFDDAYFAQVAAGITATGGTITDVGLYRIHSFTNVGTTNFTVTAGSGSVEWLVSSGGGGGGGNTGGGGGGGGVKTGTNTFGVSNLSITVGAHGAGAVSYIARGGFGSNSVFGTNTANGGGGGGGKILAALNGGGSGGGGSQNLKTPGTGTDGQGHRGGTGVVSGIRYAGGGGGGVSGVGSNGAAATVARGGNGGEGVASSISGTLQVYGSGGGGGSHDNNTAGNADNTYGIGGTGAGNGGVCDQAVVDRFPTAATYYGGGGGGAGWESTTPSSGCGTNGFQGIVIVRYLQ